MKFEKNIFGGISIIYCWLLVIEASTIKNKRSLADNIQSGIQFAGKILGVDTASDVADLVAKAFSNNLNSAPKSNMLPVNDNNKERVDQPPFLTENQPGPGLISNLLRIMGLDSGKIGALAVNGIIFIAQMIGRSLISSFAAKWQQPSPTMPLRAAPPWTQTTPNTDEEIYRNQKPPTITREPNEDEKYPRGGRKMSIEGTPLDWVLENQSSPFQKMLNEVRDRNLPQRIEEMVGKMENTVGEAECLKLLVCKSAPFVWGMQRAIIDRLDNSNGGNVGDGDDVNNEVNSNENRLYTFFKYLPDLKDFIVNGKSCESKYSECILTTSVRVD